MNASDTNPYRYCGEYYDFESGTIYLRARYYSPTHGRFTQPDRHWNTGNMIYGDADNTNADAEQAAKLLVPDILAIRQSSNLYVYCGNNPVCMIDMWGESYTNEITDGENAGEYIIVTKININNTDFEFEYYIKDGVISFDFSENDYGGLLAKGGGKELASAMYKAAMFASPEYLSGRTTGGINTELQIHWAAYTLGILTEHTQSAEMGGTKSNKPGYDNNAWASQLVQSAKAGVKCYIFPIYGVIDEINELREYMR